MAKVAANLVRVYLDQYNISGYLNAEDLSVKQELAKVDTFSDAGPRRVVGNHDHMGDHGGFFDGADDAYDEILATAFGTDADHYLTALPGGAVENTRGYDRLIRLAEKPYKAGIGAAQLLSFKDEGSGPIVRCTVLRSATVTGTGSGTGRNLGATTSGQVFAVIYRVLDWVGTGTLVLQIHESSDDGGSDAYANIAALASGNLTGVGVTRKTTASATEAYKRVTVSTFSSLTSATILVTAGVVPGTP